MIFFPRYIRGWRSGWLLNLCKWSEPFSMQSAFVPLSACDLITIASVVLLSVTILPPTQEGHRGLPCFCMRKIHTLGLCSHSVISWSMQNITFGDKPTYNGMARLGSLLFYIDNDWSYYYLFVTQVIDFKYIFVYIIWAQTSCSNLSACKISFIFN